MSTTEQKYGTIEQALTITIDSLAHGGVRESTLVDNKTNRFVEVLISGTLEALASVGVDSYARIFAYGRTGSGLFTGSATGADAAYGAAAGQPGIKNLKYLGTAFVNAATTESFEWGPFSLKNAFGAIPDEWGVVLEWNDSGASIALHTSGNVVNYQGIKYESVA